RRAPASALAFPRPPPQVPPPHPAAASGLGPATTPGSPRSPDKRSASGTSRTFRHPHPQVPPPHPAAASGLGRATHPVPPVARISAAHPRHRGRSGTHTHRARHLTRRRPSALAGLRILAPPVARLKIGS